MAIKPKLIGFFSEPLRCIRKGFHWKTWQNWILIRSITASCLTPNLNTIHGVAFKLILCLLFRFCYRFHSSFSFFQFTFSFCSSTASRWLHFCRKKPPRRKFSNEYDSMCTCFGCYTVTMYTWKANKLNVWKGRNAKKGKKSNRWRYRRWSRKASIFVSEKSHKWKCNSGIVVLFLLLCARHECHAFVVALDMYFYSICCSIPSLHEELKHLQMEMGFFFFRINLALLLLFFCFGCCWLATQCQRHKIHGSTVNKGFYSFSHFYFVAVFIIFYPYSTCFFVYARVDWFIYTLCIVWSHQKLWTSLSNDANENDAKDDKCIHIRQRTQVKKREKSMHSSVDF